MLSNGAGNASAAATDPPGNPKRDPPGPKKAKTADKLALELIQKGALKIVEADSLKEQLIANNVYPTGIYFNP